MFPPIEPYEMSWLPVADGNELYYEVSGNSAGHPVVYLHGGPGGGIATGYRRHFDPARCMIVSFEQRGCGRSRPLATVPVANLAKNTTHALVTDIEALRLHLGVERWLVCGMSWGTTLALAYVQAHPERVSGVILSAVTMTTSAEVAWVTEAMGRIFPERWAQLVAVAQPQPEERVIDACYRLVRDPDPVIRARVAQAWCDWENTHISLNPGYRPWEKFQDPDFSLLFATLVLHYWANAAFLEDDALLNGMSRLADIPGVLVHGRHDISLPADVAWKLHNAWPKSRIVIVEDEGHGGAKMMNAVTEAAASLLDLSK